MTSCCYATTNSFHSQSLATGVQNVHVSRGGVNLRSGVLFFLFVLLLCFFGSRGKQITPSSRERHKGLIGRGHDLRLGWSGVKLMHLIQDSRLPQTANVRLTLRISQNKKQITTVPVPMVKT